MREEIIKGILSQSYSLEFPGLTHHRVKKSWIWDQIQVRLGLSFHSPLCILGCPNGLGSSQQEFHPRNKILFLSPPHPKNLGCSGNEFYLNKFFISCTLTPGLVQQGNAEGISAWSEPSIPSDLWLKTSSNQQGLSEFIP